MKSLTCILTLGTYLLLLASCSKDDKDMPSAVVFSAAGNISGKMEEFRTRLGNLNTVPGAGEGRREINWDGVPDSMLNEALPNRFFNTIGNNVPASRQRGLVYEIGELQVGSNFAHINAEAASEFTPFSGSSSFANVNSNDWGIDFEEPGQAVPAAVRAFGAVFADVDTDSSTALEFFDGQRSLGRYFVPRKPAGQSFSFLGVLFPDRIVTHVRVVHQGKLSDGSKDISQGGTQDLVTMDDLIYSEPVRK
ncbi:MAG TPA: hypothetical protein VFR58_01630 [Flavisolibacter sp.]|nr:hypothetical protein [Flavisolibacter sp.]